MPFIALYREVPPPITSLMIIRLVEGAPLHKEWVPIERISPNLMRAVVSSEDARFCRHSGFDWLQIGDAWRDWRRGGRLRGASTITMQTARNLLLWPGRNLLRKASETYLTILLESLWSKRRILEVYLNIVEWGHGLYGAERAARFYFGIPAAVLSPRQAALMAAVLPNPGNWSPVQPSPYVASRAATILRYSKGADIPFPSGCPHSLW